VNVFLLGVAYQAGLLPLSCAAIEEAIRLNGVEVERNLEGFRWGRRYYQDAAAVEELLAPPRAATAEGPLIERRAAELERYQNRAYALEYVAFVAEVEARRPALAEAVARNLYKLMAYKDEYEVARLLTRPEFERQLREQWDAVEAIGYNLHPPLLRALGLKKKMRLGGWFRGPLRALARLKFLRGTALDPFGYAAARREERALIGWYRDLVRRSLHDPALAAEMAALPERIRGYEQIKLGSIREVKALAREKLAGRGAATAGRAPAS
jgi:indolepyruvate ferredoxin oxidoreductase